jgi:hypothetical protein
MEAFPTFGPEYHRGEVGRGFVEGHVKTIRLNHARGLPVNRGVELIVAQRARQGVPNLE